MWLFCGCPARSPMTHRLAYRRYTLPLRAPVRTAHGVLAERSGLIVRIEDVAGRVGYGEAAPLPGFGRETVDADEAACRALGDGLDAERLSGIPAELGCLRHALEEASRLDPRVPVHPYLPVAALLPAGRAALAKVDGLAEAGFRTFKWKVGVADAADEMALMDDLLARLPEGARLRLDANGAWDRRTTERWLSRCADYPVEHVEQPIAADARGAEDLLMGIAGDYPTPVALDESLAGFGDLERWMQAGWPGVYVVKPSLIAGMDAALAALAKADAKVVFSSALETAVGARTALQAAFAWAGGGDRAVRALGFGVWPLFMESHFDGPFLAPFIRAEDVARINPEAVWTALS